MPQSRLERVVPCDMLLWPDCTPPQTAKPPKPIPLRAYDLNSVRSILVNKTTHICSQASGFRRASGDSRGFLRKEGFGMLEKGLGVWSGTWLC